MRAGARDAVDGVFLLDKPLGMSSNEALLQVRRLFNARKAGHGGTLDPMATGLLPVMLGEATKFAHGLLDADKTYVAELMRGQTRVGGDTEGAVIESRPVVCDEPAVGAACRSFAGRIAQVPPMHSALKHQGRPLYELARAGEQVPREPREVTIHRIEVLSVSLPRVTLRVHCSKGTYIRTLAQDILGTTQVPYGEEVFDFGKPFEKLTMREAIKKYRPETNMADLDNFDSAKAIAESIGIKVEKSWGLGRIVTEIFEEVAEAHLIQPTFITEYPAEVSPLARRNDENPEITDRFEFFIGGRELANGFSELNDAEDQAERFQAQVDQKAAGDDEAMFYDADFVTALEHGLPPTAGQGIGIDRLVMLFTNSHTIRDVILFPALRPQK
jgi:lysyl-tRNA synthetase class 2